MTIEIQWGGEAIFFTPETADRERDRYVWASHDYGHGYFRATQMGTSIKRWTAVFSGTAHIGDGPTAQDAFDALRSAMSHDHRLLKGALG